MLKKTITMISVLCISALFSLGTYAVTEEYYIYSASYNNILFQGVETTDYDVQYKNPDLYPQYKYARFDSKSKTAQQGLNGFYYMYSTLYNQGGSFDTATFGECVWSRDYYKTKYSAWGDYNWGPAVAYDAVKYPDSAWWAIFVDGRIVSDGDITAAVKWVAPADGAYNLNTRVQYGRFDPEDPNWMDDVRADSDGNFVMIYKNNERLFMKEAMAMQQPEASFKKDLTLKQGDALYFIEDQKEKPNFDRSLWKVKITRTIEDAISAPNESIDISSEPESIDSIAGESDISSSNGESSDILSSSEESSAANSAAPANDSNKNNNGNPLGWITAIIAALVILGGGTAYYFFVMKKKNNPVR